MEHQTVYRCPGSCKGVSAVATNCGASDCAYYHKPLQAYLQCDACAAAYERDGKAHGCPGCKIL